MIASRLSAIVCAQRPSGEHGAVVRLLSAEAGLIAVYVAGARGRVLRPVLVAGNMVAAEVTSRGDTRLPVARVELVASRAPWLAEPLPGAALAWVTVLTATALPEGQPLPALYQALGGLIDAITLAPSARGWVRALAAYETLLLRELGVAGGLAPPPDEAWPDALDRLDRLGRILAARVLADRPGDAMAARTILTDRLRRIGT